MVSSAKLRRAQTNIVNLRPYAQKIQHVIRAVAESHKVEHPLLGGTGEARRILLYVFASDRGLCGAFNNAVNRSAFEFYQKSVASGASVDVIAVGRKAFDYFKRRDVIPKEQRLPLEKAGSLAAAQELANQSVATFLAGEYDAVYITFNEFQSALAQVPRVQQLLPLSQETAQGDPEERSEASGRDVLFEPTATEIVDDLLRRHFSYSVYRCMCESLASEHGARMTAMENATKNAQQMIQTLTLTYNKMRQAAITTELIEITSGAEALKG